MTHSMYQNKIKINRILLKEQIRNINYMVIIIIIKNKNNTKMKKMIDCRILVIELNLIKY